LNNIIFFNFKPYSPFILKQKKPERQLYTLITKLSTYVESRDDLGILVGYCVIGSLLDFKTKTGSQQERQFEEIKEIYKGLEKTIATCETNETSDGYIALCEIKNEKESILKKFLSQPLEPKDETPLLTKIISHLSLKKNYADVLRRKGIGLINNLNSRGQINGTKNILTKDYHIIEEIFSK